RQAGLRCGYVLVALGDRIASVSSRWLAGAISLWLRRSSQRHGAVRCDPAWALRAAEYGPWLQGFDVTFGQWRLGERNHVTSATGRRHIQGKAAARAGVQLCVAALQDGGRPIRANEHSQRRAGLAAAVHGPWPARINQRFAFCWSQ